MTPIRKRKFQNGDVVEEFYWTGKYVIYVNNQKIEDDYEEACRKIELKLSEEEII
ncbi:MAG: hypothetical protein JSV96_08410 [Candidatus Aminicenantes bacterium]|nr:MAG: hypothetical protein JSV96_08410 [Candidatus Aminicenantes bacterium]